MAYVLTKRTSMKRKMHRGMTHEDLGRRRSTGPGGITLISDFWLQDSETRVRLLKPLMSVVLGRPPQETHTRPAASLPLPVQGWGPFLFTPGGFLL